MKKIIVVSGEMASGKGAVAQYLAKMYDATNVKSSDVFRRVLDVLHVEQTREAVSEMSRVLRLGFGENIAVRVILEDCVHSEHDIVVIEGLRRKEEIETLKEGSFEVLVIFLVSDTQLRYDRMTQRNENEGDDNKTFEEFQKNHKLDAESHVGDVKLIADHIVENDGTLEQLYAKINSIVKL